MVVRQYNKALNSFVKKWQGCVGGDEWLFLLTLVVPSFVLHLALKTWRVTSTVEFQGINFLFDVYKSDIFLHIGLAGLGVVWLLSSENKHLKSAVFGALQLVVVGVAAIEIVAHQFFLSTGSTLDYFLVAFSLSQFEETWTVIASEVATMTYVALIGFCSAFLGIPWVARAWLAKKDPETSPCRRRTRSYKVRVFLCVAACFSIWAASWAPRSEIYVSFARASALNMGLSAWDAVREREFKLDVEPRQALTNIRLVSSEKIQNKPKNIAIIILESTRARSVSVYEPTLKTTPYLEELAEKSLVAERAYAVVPHTSKALVAILCGIEPRLNMPITEALPDGIPARCLADLLGEQGYHSVFFQSATEAFEQRRALVQNMGFETFVPLEEMDKEGFVKANYFGYEDNIMLAPSEVWLREHGARPFLATYLTLTPHHDYRAPQRYGRKQFDEDDELNRYLNSIYYLDRFIERLLNQYRKLGLYEDTLFVIVGDHGEGFGEHGRRQHDNVIYEEGLHVPLLIYDPAQSDNSARIDIPVSQLDIVPTVLEWLGYRIDGGALPGVHMAKVVKDRLIKAHCWYERRCMASIQGDDKYVFHFHRQPDEFFNLAEDPLEQRNVANFRADLSQKRHELLRWRAQVIGMYKHHNSGLLNKYIRAEKPQFAYNTDIQLGSFARVIGYDISQDAVRPGDRLTVTTYFEVLSQIPAKWKLFAHGHGPGRMMNLDHVPVYGLYPLQEWKPGQFVRDVQEIRIPSGWGSGSFELYLGIYHPEKGRVTITGDAATDGNDRVLLLSVPVVR